MTGQVVFNLCIYLLQNSCKVSTLHCSYFFCFKLLSKYQYLTAAYCSWYKTNSKRNRFHEEIHRTQAHPSLATLSTLTSEESLLEAKTRTTIALATAELNKLFLLVHFFLLYSFSCLGCCDVVFPCSTFLYLHITRASLFFVSFSWIIWTCVCKLSFLCYFPYIFYSMSRFLSRIYGIHPWFVLFCLCPVLATVDYCRSLVLPFSLGTFSSFETYCPIFSIAHLLVLLFFYHCVLLFLDIYCCLAPG